MALELLFCLIPASYCAVTDIKRRIIPNKITFPLLLAGFIYAVYSGNIKSALLGLAVAGGIMLVCALMGGAGGGDFKLAAALGLWFGFQCALQILLIGSIIGAIWGFTQLAKQKKFLPRITLFFRGIFCEVIYGMKGAMILPKLPESSESRQDTVPFGTCLTVAAWLVWIMMYQVYQVY